MFCGPAVVCGALWHSVLAARVQTSPIANAPHPSLAGARTSGGSSAAARFGHTPLGGECGSPPPSACPPPHTHTQAPAAVGAIVAISTGR
eukprot:gene10950-biopygen6327